ncbi:MAG TPA: PVC-type heme-binding CxxCH protein [Verrucomicrobiae bacterium]
MKPVCRFALFAILAAVVPFAHSAEFKIGVHNFTLPDGFTVEKVAGPGLIDRPIVADFDELGRLYVAESSGSNDPVHEQLKQKPHRIVRLEDTNHDGTFDKSVVYADKMMFPEGAMWLNGSLYVSAPPVIWRLTDTDNDGVADKREEWLDAKTLTGCANDLHGPYLGLDGWVYWCKGAFAKQTYERAEGAAFETRAAHIFRRRPEGGLVEAVMTGGMDNPVDVTFTPEGERIFTTTFFQHPGGGQRDGLVHAIYGGVYGKVHDVIDDHKKTGDLMPVLTHLGPAAPSGLTRYESEVFGRDYRDNLFVALFNLHKVTRHILQPVSATYKTVDSDFLVSDNTDFHPTDVIEDADGSLLVIDTGGWYKLCCPTSQLWKPDVLGAIYRIRRDNSPRLEDPRGNRIDFKKANVQDLANLLNDPRAYVARRAIHELRTRKDAARTLEKLFRGEAPERQQINAVWALAGGLDSEAPNSLSVALNQFRPSSVRHAAVHALSTDIERADFTQLATIVTEPEVPPSVRRAAAEAVGRTKNPEGVAWLQMAAATLKPAANGLPDRVEEHSIIYALIEINSPEAIRSHLKAYEKKAPVPAFMQRAALIALDQISSGALRADDVIPLLTSADSVLQQTARWIVGHRKDWGKELAHHFEGRFRQANVATQDLKETAELVLQLVDSEHIRIMISQLVLDSNLGAPARKAMFEIMSRASLKETPPSWVQSITTLLNSNKTDPEIMSALSSLRLKEVTAELKSELERIAREAELPASTRLQAISSLGANQKLSTETFSLVQEQLKSTESNQRRLALSILGKSGLTEEQLLQLADHVKSSGPIDLSALLGAYEKGSTERAGERLLEALKASSSLAALNPDQIQRTFAKFPQPIKARAADFAVSLNADHTQQHARIEELLPKLKDGDIRRGQAIFNSQAAACSTCHAIGYLGGDLGPDLTRIGQIRTERDLLEAILYPSSSFVRSYEPVVIETKGNDQFSGILKKDAPDEVVLATGPGAEVRLARGEISDTRPGKVSVMPQGLNEQLSEQQLADLLAFLRATRW